MLSSVDILGAGPAGLYTAILLRRAFPQARLRVFEQNPQGATFGFGVVFSEQALDFLRADDPETHDLIVPRMERWQNMTLNHPDGRVVIDGVGFTAIGRLALIELLRERAQALGVVVDFDTRIDDPLALDADLVIGADGLNSVLRGALADDLGPSLAHFGNRFAWFGATRDFDTLTQSFIHTPHGPMNAHHYRFAPGQSTFIVECDEAVFQAAGFAQMTESDSAARCEALFAGVLDGAKLVTNKSNWRQFPRLWCENWVARGKYALLGDAVHTAHFSVGSGTRLAMEDAIALVRALREGPDVATALEAYQAARPPVAHKIVQAANTSAQWYEGFGARMALHPLDFGYDYITRSGRVTDDRLRAMAPGFMALVDAHRGTPTIADPVGDTPCARAIGFDKSRHPNASAILWDNLARNPDKPALVGDFGTLSYRDLIAQAAQWGHALTGAGVKRGERVAFFLDDTPLFPAAFFGAVRAGFVPVLLNIQTPPDVLAYFLKDCGARVVVTDQPDAFTPEVLAHSRVEQVVGAGFQAGMLTVLACADTGPDDPAFWMYSSGSTGRPKGIVHLHHDMAYSQASFGAQVLRLRPDDICFSVPKMYFAYGFGNSLTFPFAVGATTVLLAGQPRPGVVLDAIEAHKPTVFFGLPTLFTALAREPGVGARDLTSIRQSMSAAEILSADIHAAWKALTGHGPTEGLGSTEMLHVYLSNIPTDQRLGAAGAVVPGYEVKLLDPDGVEAREGVMLVRGTSSAPCYWNRPDKTAETMRGDWIWTGDRFREERGYYYFLGRADDLVKVSGQWVWPMEVERCLNDHPLVHECAVLAQEQADRRMVLRAVVALRAGGGDDAVVKVLQDHVKATLAPYKYPRLVEFRDALPKTGTGKIDRQALR